MNNIVHVYHIKDQYDHSLGYTVYNSYTNLMDETIKDLIAKHERYLKNPDMGGYWIQVITCPVGGEYTIQDHIKILPQKTRIELNLKAKTAGKSIKSMKQIFEGALVNANAVAPAPVFDPNFMWNAGQDVVIEIDEEQEENN